MQSDDLTEGEVNRKGPLTVHRLKGGGASCVCMCHFGLLFHSADAETRLIHATMTER